MFLISSKNSCFFRKSNKTYDLPHPVFGFIKSVPTGLRVRLFLYLCNSNPNTRHDSCRRHRHRPGLHSRPVRRRMGFGPPRRQRRLLHRQPPHPVVHGGFRHDRRRDVGRDFHFGSRLRGRRLVFLHADGRGFHGGAAGCGFRPHSHVLPPACGLTLRVSRRPLRRKLPPHRGVVFLHFEDAGRRAARLCGLRRDAAAGLFALRLPVLGQRPRHDVFRLALHPAGRRQIADLDRYAQVFLPRGEPRAVDRLHRAGTRPLVRRHGPRGLRFAHVAHFLLRRSRF